MIHAFFSSKSRLAGLMALVAAVLTVVVATGAAAHRAKLSLPAVARMHVAARKAHIPASRYFSVLRRAHVASALSAEQAKELAAATSSAMKQQYSLNDAQAVPLSVKTLSSRHAYAIPGIGSLCLYVPDSTGFGSSTCEATQVAMLGYVIGVEYGSLSSDDATVVGLAPDGVSSVVGTAADGSSVRVPVVGNAYELHLNHLRAIQVGSNVLNIPAPLG